jgi:hypothetical protein
MTSKYYSKSAAIRKLTQFNNWLGTVRSKKRIVIGGNHDHYLQLLGKDTVRGLLTNCEYLENDLTTHEQLQIFATPASTGRSENKAFQSKSFLKEAQSLCPPSVDILVTHGQCPELTESVAHKVHIWGHNHNSYGVRYPGDSLLGRSVTSLSVCAPMMDGHFKLRHLPIVLDLPRDPAAISVPSHDRVTARISDQRDGDSDVVAVSGAVTTVVQEQKLTSSFLGHGVVTDAPNSMNGGAADSLLDTVHIATRDKHQPGESRVVTGWRGRLWMPLTSRFRIRGRSGGANYRHRVVPVELDE